MFGKNREKFNSQNAIRKLDAEEKTEQFNKNFADEMKKFVQELTKLAHRNNEIPPSKQVEIAQRIADVYSHLDLIISGQVDLGNTNPEVMEVAKRLADNSEAIQSRLETVQKEQDSESNEYLKDSLILIGSAVDVKGKQIVAPPVFTNSTADSLQQKIATLQRRTRIMPAFIGQKSPSDTQNKLQTVLVPGVTTSPSVQPIGQPQQKAPVVQKNNAKSAETAQTSKSQISQLSIPNAPTSGPGEEKPEESIPNAPTSGPGEEKPEEGIPNAPTSGPGEEEPEEGIPNAPLSVPGEEEPDGSNSSIPDAPLSGPEEEEPEKETPEIKQPEAKAEQTNNPNVPISKPGEEKPKQEAPKVKKPDEAASKPKIEDPQKVFCKTKFQNRFYQVECERKKCEEPLDEKCESLFESDQALTTIRNGQSPMFDSSHTEFKKFARECATKSLQDCQMAGTKFLTPPYQAINISKVRFQDLDVQSFLAAEKSYAETAEREDDIPIFDRLIERSRSDLPRTNQEVGPFINSLFEDIVEMNGAIFGNNENKTNLEDAWKSTIKTYTNKIAYYCKTYGCQNAFETCTGDCAEILPVNKEKQVENRKVVITNTTAVTNKGDLLAELQKKKTLKALPESELSKTQRADLEYKREQEEKAAAAAAKKKK